MAMQQPQQIQRNECNKRNKCKYNKHKRNRRNKYKHCKPIQPIQRIKFEPLLVPFHYCTPPFTNHTLLIILPYLIDGSQQQDTSKQKLSEQYKLLRDQLKLKSI